MEGMSSKREMELRNAAQAQGKTFDMTNVKEKLVQAEKPAISEFQNSLLADADVAKRIANALDTKNTANFVTLLQHCSGVVLTSGIGKSGIVAERLSASLASTGTPSHYVHAAEWTHGDLGRARNGDVAVFLSHSGNTKECVAAAELLKDRGITVLSIVGKYDCGLRAWSDALINYGVAGTIQDSIGGAPTRSIVVQAFSLHKDLSVVFFNTPLPELKGLWSDEQNILLQLTHKKEFWILSNKFGKELKHENEARGHGLLSKEMIVNAIECELMARRKFTKTDFLHNHPGGSLGKKLTREQLEKE